jgi:hypothetical protein
VYNIQATHAMVTDFYGPDCDVEESPYIVNCNYDLAFDMLNHLYENKLEKPNLGQNLTGEVKRNTNFK